MLLTSDRLHGWNAALFILHIFLLNVVESYCLLKTFTIRAKPQNYQWIALHCIFACAYPGSTQPLMNTFASFLDFYLRLKAILTSDLDINLTFGRVFPQKRPCQLYNFIELPITVLKINNQLSTQDLLISFYCFFTMLGL